MEEKMIIKEFATIIKKVAHEQYSPIYTEYFRKKENRFLGAVVLSNMVMDEVNTSNYLKDIVSNVQGDGSPYDYEIKLLNNEKLYTRISFKQQRSSKIFREIKEKPGWIVLKNIQNKDDRNDNVNKALNGFDHLIVLQLEKKNDKPTHHLGVGSISSKKMLQEYNQQENKCVKFKITNDQLQCSIDDDSFDYLDIDKEFSSIPQATDAAVSEIMNNCFSLIGSQLKSLAISMRKIDDKTLLNK